MKGPSYFEIQAEDTTRAVKFYSQLFDWKFEKDENVSVEYWRIDADGQRGGLLKRPAKTPPMEYGTNSYVCSMEVGDFDAIVQKIISLGGIVALPKFAVPGVCWQGYFLDPEGNTFGIYQPDPSAK